MNDSVSMITETQNSTDFFSPSTSRDSSTGSVTTTVQTGDELTSSVTTDGDLVSSVETETSSELVDQSYTTTFSQSLTTSNESGTTSYTSFEKERLTFFVRPSIWTINTDINRTTVQLDRR